MSDQKLLALSLDALDEWNIYQLQLEFIQELYEDRGKIFTCSTVPHTAVSNPMIFGGIQNDDKFWVEKEDDDRWVDPAQHFDRSKGQPVDGAKGFSRADDYTDESFIWDDLYAAGYDARALQVPIVLPPYSFNTKHELEESWFPDTKARMADHIRRKPTHIGAQFAGPDGADAVFSSIQMPDKWLHGIGEGKCSEGWVLSEAPVFDEQIERLVTYLDDHDISWVMFGDHGSPHPGAVKKNGYILPRHRKESIILSSEDLDPPTYTDELYEWMLDLFDVEPVGSNWKQLESDTTDGDVEERLKNLGYL